MILGVLTTATAEAWIPRALVGSTRRHVPRVLPHSRHKGRDNDDNSSPSRRHMQPLSVPLWLATRPWLTHLRGGGVIASSVVEAAKSVIKKVGASKANCYAVLVTCILLETVSTSLSKYAKENSSPIHFLMACGIYIFTYVSNWTHVEGMLAISHSFSTSTACVASTWPWPRSRWAWPMPCGRPWVHCSSRPWALSFFEKHVIRSRFSASC